MNQSEPVSSAIEGFICEGCKGVQFNPATGRCSKCLLPPENLKWCYQCNSFWLPSNETQCPKDGQTLRRYKAGMALKRLCNFIIDGIAIRLIIGFIIGLLSFSMPVKTLVPAETSEANSVTSDSVASIPQPMAVKEPWYINNWLLILGTWFGYYFVFESIFQRTFGKFITGTKVITATGGKPDIATIAKRSLIRLIPFEPFSFLGPKVCGWHDKWTGTFVVC